MAKKSKSSKGPRLNLERAMKKGGVEDNYYQLAKKLEMAYPNVFKMKSEDWNPRFSTIVEICEKLDISIYDLIEA